MVGDITQRIVDTVIIEKICMQHLRTENIGKELEEHKFPINYEGLREGMEEITV